MKSSVLTLLVLATFAYNPALRAQTSTARSPDMDRRLAEVLTNWKLVSPQSLRAPANADLLRELKLLAAKPSSATGRILLIRAGDPEAVNDCFMRLRSKDMMTMDTAAKQLRAAANPGLISALAADLNKVESADLVIKEDIGFSPLSVKAAGIITKTITDNPDFPLAVKEWAKNLHLDDADYREAVRVWWNLNKAAIEAGNYQATVVVPPSH